MLRPVAFQMLQVGHCRHPECIVMRGGAWRQAMFPALCAWIRHPIYGNWLFDTGYGSHFFEATEPFPERLYRWVTPVQLPESQRLAVQLQMLGLQPEDIDGVVISHFHGDHIGGLKDFPRAVPVASRAAHAHVSGLSRTAGLMQGFLPALLPADFARRCRYLDSMPRVELPPELRAFGYGLDILGDASLLAVPLHGHAHQQFGLLLRREDGRLVFLVADACWSLKALQGRRLPTWLAQRTFADRGAYRDVFDKLSTLSQRHAGILVVPSHCEETARALTPRA